MPDRKGTRRKPEWIKAKIPSGPNYTKLRNLVREFGLHTVCEEAKCPNIGECWGAGTLTFMILGDVCTRSCGFCHVKTEKAANSTGKNPPEWPRRSRSFGKTTRGSRHVVITSVNRDDRNYESACIFARTVEEVRKSAPGIKIEVLIPDFKGEPEAIHKVIASSPDVLNHNIETVSRLYSLPQKTQSGRTRSVRPQAVYGRSLELLSLSAKTGRAGMLTKSGIMVGLGKVSKKSSKLSRISSARVRHSYHRTVSAAHCRSYTGIKVLSSR